jgi:tetratricopeptide (TPR) repeat protein
MRGNSYLAKYEFANAYADYTEAIRTSPNIYQPYVSRGVLNIVLENNKQAISDLEMSIQLSQQFAIIYFYLSILYENEGNSVKAKEMMNKYLNFDQ